MPEARTAVARDYARRGIATAADRIVLTSSTSEAYSLLFKLLCNAGDEVLVPRPSYPLFEYLSRLDLVSPRSYDLEYHGSWTIDFTSLERQWSPRTRAVLVVNPNNPTGSFATRQELEHLSAVCAARDTALITDEVFADYELNPGTATSALQQPGAALVCALGGLSKSVGLPQAKLSWIAVGGPRDLADAALARLEVACDTYLSVSTPGQVACEDLLRRGAAIRDDIAARIRANYRTLRSAEAGAAGCSVLNADGGWYAIVRVPSIAPEEELAVTLLVDEGVLAHPGYFFDFPGEAFLVVSLLPPTADFAEGIGRLLRHFACRLARP
jgi:hypothetical protein